MASLPSLSSSSSLSLFSSPRETTPLLLMGNLLSVMGGSDVAVQQEIVKISQVISVFIEQTTQQLQGMTHRIVELEAEVIRVSAARQEAMLLCQAQMRAIENFTQMLTLLNQRVGALESRAHKIENRLQTTNMNLQALTKRHNIHRHEIQHTHTGALTSQYRE